MSKRTIDWLCYGPVAEERFGGNPPKEERDFNAPCELFNWHDGCCERTCRCPHEDNLRKEEK